MTAVAEVKAPAQPHAVLEEFQRLYGPPAGEDGPVRMVREVFAQEPDPWQIEVLRAFGRCERRISIRSCPGVGKTTVAAWCVWNQLLCRFPQKTAMTAPTAPQMFDALYAEIKMWGRRLPAPLQSLFDLKSDRIEYRPSPEESFVTAKTARQEQPEAIQGIHSVWVLLIVDEASGVPEAIFEAGIGSMSGPHATTLLLSNPVRTTGYFKNTQESDRWLSFHIHGLPGYPRGIYSDRVTADYVRQVIDDYGEDSNQYRVRVLGEFPRADYDGIIPYELVESSLTRDVKASPTAPWVWGLDVARMGDDCTALCKRHGNVVSEPIRIWHELDLMQVVGMVKAEWDMCPPTDKPAEIMVDAIGLGAGVADRLRELQLPARAINVAELPALSGDTYVNLRTELWFQAKDWFAKRDVWMPRDAKLEKELTAQKYKAVESSGKIVAIPKIEMKKFLRRSPDRADALCLTFAATASTALYGGNINWSAPIKRRVKGLV